ncbi:MAG: putative ABC transport system ATP-binding protein [Bacteriovoracaceae bacterium]|jgi:putative ABC transport system ATP-binding protein
MILNVQNLKKSYSQGTRKLEIINDLNLGLEKGSTLAILGQSGSGKSTLLSLLSGLDQPDDGKIILDGMDLGSLGESELTDLRAKKIGIIFQNFHLLPHLSALENVALSLEILKMDQPFEVAKKWLSRVGLSSREDHFPDQLSGGEKQRVAIARALSISPDLILADEPSGSLDEETGDKVMDLIFGLVREENSTLILVTHNKELAKNCEKTVHLHGGKLVES